TDSVFQFDVEGTVTGTVTPNTPGAFNVNWGDFTGTCQVSDGRLTVRSGPNSQTTANNNKFTFIDIYNAVAVPIVVSDPVPSSTTVVENRPISISVTTSPVRPL